MSRYFLLALVGVLVLLDGSLCGYWGGRWKANEQLAASTAKLERLPLTFGDWQGERQELEAKIVERAGFSGYVLRRYENQRGEVVSILLACGRPGPLSVHTPEICYGGAGFVMAGDAKRWTPAEEKNAPAADFWKVVFARPNSTSPEKLQVLWSWNKNGVWVAADHPRWTFAGTPVLYKLYVTQSFVPHEEGAEGETCQEFLREFLPEIDKLLAQER